MRALATLRFAAESAHRRIEAIRAARSSYIWRREHEKARKKGATSSKQRLPACRFGPTSLSKLVTPQPNQLPSLS